MEFVYDLNTIEKAAKHIVENANNQKIWCFNGAMGSGKSTLIKAICNYLEVVDETSSPTFSIVNEYKTRINEVIYHFDFYRINDLSEALDIGVLEMFDSGNLCFIEWSEKIIKLIPPEVYLIEIVQEDIDEVENGIVRKLIVSNE